MEINNFDNESEEITLSDTTEKDIACLNTNVFNNDQTDSENLLSCTDSRTSSRSGIDFDVSDDKKTDDDDSGSKICELGTEDPIMSNDNIEENCDKENCSYNLNKECSQNYNASDTRKRTCPFITTEVSHNKRLKVENSNTYSNIMNKSDLNEPLQNKELSSCPQMTHQKLELDTSNISSTTEEKLAIYKDSTNKEPGLKELLTIGENFDKSTTESAVFNQAFKRSLYINLCQLSPDKEEKLVFPNDDNKKEPSNTEENIDKSTTESGFVSQAQKSNSSPTQERNFIPSNIDTNSESDLEKLNMIILPEIKFPLIAGIYVDSKRSSMFNTNKKIDTSNENIDENVSLASGSVKKDNLHDFSDEFYFIDSEVQPNNEVTSEEEKQTNKIKRNNGFMKNLLKSFSDTLDEDCLKPIDNGKIGMIKKLPSLSTEYTRIKSNFDTSMLKGRSETVLNTITKITKVVCPYLWAQFQIKKEKKRKLDGFIFEEEVYHGTQKQNILPICKYNFDWRKCGTHRGTKFGKGISFGKYPTYASHYPKTREHPRAMLLTNIICVNKQLGHTSMTVPDDGFDTSINGKGEVIVKYEDADYYPSYIIYYDNDL